MKKSIWIFLFAVLLPGGVLGWLALRSAGEQQIIFERRTAELYQKETEDLATAVRDVVQTERRAFSDVVHKLLGKSDAHELARDFTNTLSDAWPRKATGFAIGPDGKMLSPSAALAAKDVACQDFLWNNGSFLCSQQRAVVYPVPIESVGNNYNVQLRQRAQTLNDPAQFPAQNSQMQQQILPPATPAPDTEGQPAIIVRKGEADIVIAQSPQSAAKEPEPQKFVKSLIPAKPAAPAPRRSAPVEGVVTAAAGKEEGNAPRDPVVRRTSDPALPRTRSVAEEDSPFAAEKPKMKGRAGPPDQPVGQKAASLPQSRPAPAAPAPTPLPTATEPSSPTVDTKQNELKIVKGQSAVSDVASNAAPKNDRSANTVSLAPSQIAEAVSNDLIEKVSGDPERAKLKFGGPPGGGSGSPNLLNGAVDRGFNAEETLTRPSGNVLDNTPNVSLNPPGVEQGLLPADGTFSDSIQGAGSFTIGGGQATNGTFLFKRQVTPAQDNRTQTVNWSAVVPATADFRGLTANEDEGMISRFVQDKLGLIFWMRPPEAPEIVFGCLIEVANLQDIWTSVIANGREPGAGKPGFILALLDDKSYPVSTFPRVEGSRDWKRPFVASEIGEALPHWETALYLATPTALAESARGFGRTLNFTIYAAVALIALGGWLVVAEVRRQLVLAQKKTDFVSNVSHELKTPLTSIRMFAELMHDRPPPAEKQGQYLRIITAEAERLTRLINNVLDFAKLERRQKRFEKNSLDLHTLVTRVWEGHEMHLRDSGFTTRWESAPGPYPVTGDEDALAQVLVNLLSNAEKYSSERKEVELVTWIEDGHVNLSVLDRGIGVPDGEERKIFESFYRAHDSLSSGIQGSGLGLTLAQRLAREHGGEILFERRKDGGSRFTLRLPIVGGRRDE